MNARVRSHGSFNATRAATHGADLRAVSGGKPRRIEIGLAREDSGRSSRIMASVNARGPRRVQGGAEVRAELSRIEIGLVRADPQRGLPFGASPNA